MNQETPKDFSSLISAAVKGRGSRRMAANDHIKPNHPTNKRAKIKAARAQRRKSRG